MNANMTLTATFDPQTFTLLSGTAATGDPIANSIVTVVDKNGTSRTTTTDGNGKYSVDVSGVTPPFLLKVDLPSGGSLFSVATQTGVVNIDSFTDLMTQSFYQLLNLTAQQAFILLSGSTGLSIGSGIRAQGLGTTVNAALVPPVPNELEIKPIEVVVKQTLHKWLTDNGVDPTNFDLITTPYDANGTGYSKVLASSQVDTTSGIFTIQDDPTTPAVVQNTTLSVDTKAISVTLRTTTTAVEGTSENINSTIVPTTDPLQAAVNGVNAGLEVFKNTVNSKGENLTDSDLVPFLTPDFLDGGDDRTIFAAEAAGFFRGSMINEFRVGRVLSFDEAEKVIKVTFVIRATTALDIGPDDFFTFKQVGDAWLYHGNQQIAQAHSRAATVNNKDPLGSSEAIFKVLQIQVNAPENTVASATVTGGGFLQTPMPKVPGIFIDTLRPTPTTTLEVRKEHFDLPSDAPGGTAVTEFPPTGTQFTFTVTAVDNTQHTLTDIIRATTTESISITNLTGHTLADAKLGEPLLVQWTLPKTFPILETNLIGGLTVEGGVFCHVEGGDFLAPTTSATITFPTTCAGQPVISANINVNVLGINGEQTTVSYIFR